MFSEDSEDALKSEISLVHEIALKRNLPVNFEVNNMDFTIKLYIFNMGC